MKTLLITAFEPFGGESENPSALALELLPETIGGIRLEKRLLEVTFLGAKDAVCRYVDEIKPDYAICLGQAGGRFAITPERVAINVMDARIADNAGYKPEDEPVVTGGANAHFATLPIKRMVSAMERANVAAAVSNSAGIGRYLYLPNGAVIVHLYGLAIGYASAQGYAGLVIVIEISVQGRTGIFNTAALYI